MIFEDRISTYPNRYLLTDEKGSKYYVTLERADEPVAVGTPLNAETLSKLASFSDLGDYVVSQGVSEGLRWRKWDSGVVECWCSLSQERYYSDDEGSENNFDDFFAVDLPFEIRLAQSFTNASCEEDNGEGDITTVGINAKVSGSGQTLMVEFELANISKMMHIGIDVYVVGAWK